MLLLPQGKPRGRHLGDSRKSEVNSSMFNSRRLKVQGAVVLLLYAVSDCNCFHLNDRDEVN